MSGVVQGPNVDDTNNQGFWSEGKGNGLALVARTSELAPGTAPDIHFDELFLIPYISDEENIVFRGSVAGPNVDDFNRLGIWKEQANGNLELVAWQGSFAPGIDPPAEFRIFFGWAVNSSGQVVFQNINLSGPGNRGIWSDGGGNGLQLFVRRGEIAPGTTPSQTYRSFSTPVLNDNGDVAFVGSLTSNVNPNASGFWVDRNGNGIEIIAQNGGVAPGFEDNVLFEALDFNTPAINNLGHLAFAARLSGSGIDFLNNSSIWMERGDKELVLIAQEGDNAPGTDSDVVFDEVSRLVLNGKSRVAFASGLRGPNVNDTNNRGIWKHSANDELALIAREGDQAPGLPASIVFSDLFSGPPLNGLGQVAFVARLSGVGINESNDESIWAEDLNGSLRLIVREGDQIDVMEGLGVDLRTITGISFLQGTGNEDGRLSGFNDRGQLAFWASFIDDTRGIFVSNLVAVPEPNTYALTLLGLCLAISVNMHRRETSTQVSDHRNHRPTA